MMNYLKAPKINVKHVKEVSTQVFNSKLIVTTTEYLPGPLGKIAIDYSAERIRGSLTIKRTIKVYGFNEESGEYDENGPLLSSTENGGGTKKVVFFWFHEFDKYLEIL